jgi:hypothetical protein
LALLLEGKRLNQIPLMKPELEVLRDKARFFISSTLERQVLGLAGE